MDGFINPKSIVELNYFDLLPMSTLGGRKPLNYQSKLFYVFLLIFVNFKENEYLETERYRSLRPCF